jgi:hypothetical protein
MTMTDTGGRTSTSSRTEQGATVQRQYKTVDIDPNFQNIMQGNLEALKEIQEEFATQAYNLTRFTALRIRPVQEPGELMLVFANALSNCAVSVIRSIQHGGRISVTAPSNTTTTPGPLGGWQPSSPQVQQMLDARDGQWARQIASILGGSRRVSRRRHRGRR